MKSRDEVVSKLRDICEEFSDILGLVILFGSYSRDEATENSDIDIYVESKDLKITTDKLLCSKRYDGFRTKLYDSFTEEFDVLTFGGKRDTRMVRQSKLWREIERDGIKIYEQGTKAV